MASSSCAFIHFLVGLAFKRRDGEILDLSELISNLILSLTESYVTSHIPFLSLHSFWVFPFNQKPTKRIREFAIIFFVHFVGVLSFM